MSAKKQCKWLAAFHDEKDLHGRLVAWRAKVDCMIFRSELCYKPPLEAILRTAPSMRADDIVAQNLNPSQEFPLTAVKGHTISH